MDAGVPGRGAGRAEQAWVRLGDISTAAFRIAGTALRTPLLPIPTGEHSRGGRSREGHSPGEVSLRVKPESLQPVGSFKIRGAANALLARMRSGVLAAPGELASAAEPGVLAEPGASVPGVPAEPLVPVGHGTLGVVTYSSGNHASALAYCARVFGLPATVVMPEDAPAVKAGLAESYNARIVPSPAAEREVTAHRIAEDTGALLVPPFDSLDVIAGQGTVGLEIAEDAGELAAVLVPVGGGGLASGVGIALAALRPHTQVIGVEPELAADAAEGWAAGYRVDWPAERRARTFADGLRAQPSARTFAHLLTVLDGFLTVSEEEIRAAMRVLAGDARLVTEPSGAVALAAALFRSSDLPPGPAVAVVSGGNIDPAEFARMLG